MIQSMTGFGRGCASSSSKKITVELKSLNSKQFDISTRIPGFLREYEIETRNYIAKGLERGKVELTVSIDNLATEAAATLNIPLMAVYKKQFESLGEELSLPEPADWYSLPAV